MNDAYEQQLVRELALHAQAVPDLSRPTTLAPRLIARAHVVRRRRTAGLAVAGSVVAAALVTATLAAPHWRQHALPTAPSPSPTSSADARPAPKIAGSYALVGGTVRDGEPTASSTIVLDGRRIHLPAGWAVSHVRRAGTGVVVDASILTDDGVTAYVAADGAVTRLAKVGAPTAVTPDGRQLAGVARPLTPGRTDVVLVALPGGHVVARVHLSPVELAGFADPTTLLVTDLEGTHIQTVQWGGPGPAPRVSRLAGTAIHDQLIGTDGRGHALVRRGSTLRLVTTDGGALVWSVAQSMTAAAFSGDGSRIATMTRGGVRVLSATDGTELSRSPALPATGELGQLTWQGADTVIATGRTDITAGWVVSCAVRTGRLTRLLTPSQTLLLPSS